MGYENAPFQKEWYRFLQYEFSPLKSHPDAVKRHLQLWPRGHTKTQCTTINYPSWLIGNYPDIHINIITKTATLARDILLALLTRFEADERYIELFGNLKPDDPKRWTSDELIVTRTKPDKNPTLKATGLGGAITGGRSDLIICDDLIDEENVRSELQLRKVQDWFNKIVMPTLYPWGAILVVGTRWHYADIYNELIHRWTPNVNIKKAIIDEQAGTVLWPNYWTLPKLQSIREEIGTIAFNCQYQNDPTGMEGDLLKSEWLHDWIQPPAGNIIRYAGIDPALGEGDLQAIATLTVDQTSKQAYLEDVWAERVSFPLFLQKLRRQHETYQYSKIYIESNAFQKVLTFIQELQGLPLVTTATSKNKELRFIPMSSHFEGKRVLVNPLLNNSSEFWTEWVQFPRGQHDDALDVVEIVTRNVIGAKSGGPSDAWRLG